MWVRYSVPPSSFPSLCGSLACRNETFGWCQAPHGASAVAYSGCGKNSRNVTSSRRKTNANDAAVMPRPMMTGRALECARIGWPERAMDLDYRLALQQLGVPRVPPRRRDHQLAAAGAMASGLPSRGELSLLRELERTVSAFDRRSHRGQFHDRPVAGRAAAAEPADRGPRRCR